MGSGAWILHERRTHRQYGRRRRRFLCASTTAASATTEVACRTAARRTAGRASACRAAAHCAINRGERRQFCDSRPAASWRFGRAAQPDEW